MTFETTSMPRTARGVAAPYNLTPWRVSGRALAIWFRLADPDEVRRHVPDLFDVDDDPVLGVRVWELHHNAGGDERTLLETPGRTSFHEATVAFPVRYGGQAGDNTVHIYADEPGWMLFGREHMGWPTLPGEVGLSPPPGELRPGVAVAGALRRFGRTVLEARVDLLRPLPQDEPPGLPVWLTEKLIPDVGGGPPAVHQVVRTGPSAVERGVVWEAAGTLRFGESPHDELHHLQPREVVRAEYWSHIALTLAPGVVVADLRDP